MGKNEGETFAEDVDGPGEQKTGGQIQKETDCWMDRRPNGWMWKKHIS